MTRTFRPDRIGAYFRIEWLPLALVTVSGLIYNIGLLATPWFEGRLAQCLADILGGSATAGGHGHTGAGLYRSSRWWCRRRGSSSAFTSAALPTTSTAG